MPAKKIKCPNCNMGPPAVKGFCWPCYRYQHRTGTLPNPEIRRSFGVRRTAKTITLDLGMTKKIERLAKLEKLTASAWMRQAVRERLERVDKERKAKPAA